ncbi:iron ABC transporter permease [Siminovitchia acidinfaciens]|uniref:Iron ABC transporter permease n=1 Tax=Siminovitchia acidinfaciens TaxID=2321395 RepID=A0A429XZQ4_9BACI|nr:iron ABC transporter permease [Siminovitchia acidinfaciens]RST74294.1 iron ABC transporter permease [Siminovitchia acidinfaciens]
MKKYQSVRLFKERLSVLIDQRATAVIFVLLGLQLAAIIASTGLGDVKINPVNVLKVFAGSGSDLDRLVVIDFRLPRTIIAVFVGMALAAAGGILQGMIRNPLASSDIIGITGGASAAVVGFLTVFSNSDNVLTVSVDWLPLAAFIGAFLTALLVYILAWRGGVSPIRMVLIGIGIAALTKAITTFLMIMGPIHRAAQANIWITGSVNGSNWNNVQTLVPWAVLLLLLAVFSARKINVQELGDELAIGLGSRVQKQRFFLLVISTALVGAAVAFAGGIGFVGLMAPHMARRLVGSTYGALLPASALIGGILVLLADIIGRTLFLPLEVPAGVFTAAIGAPYFIYLLFKTRNS